MKTGLSNVRGMRKSEAEFHRKFLSGGNKRPPSRNRTRMSNNQRFRETYLERLAELERRGAELEKDITKHALYYPISVDEILRRWQPDHRPN